MVFSTASTSDVTGAARLHRVASGGLMGWASLQRRLALRSCTVDISRPWGNEHTVIFVVVLGVSVPWDNGHTAKVQNSVQLVIDVGVVKADYCV